MQQHDPATCNRCDRSGPRLNRDPMLSGAAPSLDPMLPLQDGDSIPPGTLAVGMPVWGPVLIGGRIPGPPLPAVVKGFSDGEGNEVTSDRAFMVYCETADRPNEVWWSPEELRFRRPDSASRVRQAERRLRAACRAAAAVLQASERSVVGPGEPVFRRTGRTVDSIGGNR